MRQGQQNRRGRGRGGRKAPNPLVRNYESNGPDVKIRGTAAQIAEKYSTLARDAMSSGDIVAAESYLQHAEHYNRIIMAAQAQAAPNGQYAGEGYNNAPGAQRQPDEFNGGEYREPANLYAEEGRPSQQPPSPSPRQHAPSISAPNSPQPTVAAAPAPREANEGGRRRRRRHQPNGADHAMAEAAESGGGGRGANGAVRNGALPTSDESVV